MPRRPKVACARPGCGGLAEVGALCPPHRAQADQRALERKAQADQRRPSAARRGYDHRWRKLREVVLADEPLCREHAARGETVPATTVDHIVPLPDGDDSRENLQPLCASCHGEKTARHDRDGLGWRPGRHRG